MVTGEQARGRRVMVFCNTLDSCRAAEHSLREAGASTLCYHGDVPLDGRRDAIAAFTADAAQKPVLVATDLAARCAASAAAPANVNGPGMGYRHNLRIYTY